MIFICYRNSDSNSQAMSLEKSLVAEFGAESVFRDKTGIEGGDEWEQKIEHKARECHVMLAMIGATWKTVESKRPEFDGLPRLFDPGDWIRRELTIGLTKGKTVIPVLIDDTPMPKKAWLKNFGLAKLGGLDPIRLRTDEYDRDIDDLVRLLRKVYPALPQRLPGSVAALPRITSNFGSLGIERNARFVGREEPLRALLDAMFPADERRGSKVAALTQGFVGEGGIGKSQLAQRFAELTCGPLRDDRLGPNLDEAFPRDRWVRFDCAWWLDCSNDAHDQAVGILAAHLGHVRGPNETPAHLRAAIRGKLQDGRRHLLILDNVDKIADTHRTADGGASAWARAEGWTLPRGSRVLITSREQLVPTERRVGLDVLTPAEARAMLRSSRHDLSDSRHQVTLEAIAEQVGRLALALDQCRAWLDAHAGDARSLLRTLRDSDAAALALFESDEVKDQAHRYRVSVAKTLSIHMDALAGTPAERLLHAAAFAAPDAIPAELLGAAAGITEKERIDGLAKLSAKSIVHHRPGEFGGLVDVHRLTQMVVRARLAAEDAGRGAIRVVDAWLEALLSLFRWPDVAGELVDHVRSQERVAALAHAEALLGRAIPSAQSARLHGELAQRLTGLGQLTSATAHMEAAITWGESQTPRPERSLAIWYASRASIRQDRGNLEGAVEDIQRSIDWGESQTPRDERSLAIDYASRASIRQDRGDLKGAEEDVQRSIHWWEAQTPRDERSLAIRYASRASIRQNRGDLKGAEEDIQRSIDWGESQNPPDERSLAIWYASRARIRRGRGDPKGAEEDIQRSIDWWESQTPRDERGLAIRYASRARIRRAQKRFGEALDDIDAALKWFVTNLPSDELSIGWCRAEKARIEAGARMDVD